MDDKEIQQYYINAFKFIAEAGEYTPDAVFEPEIHGNIKQYLKDESFKKSINALFRFAYCDLIDCPEHAHNVPLGTIEAVKAFRLTYCLEMLFFYDNPLYRERVEFSWGTYYVWITDEGERFYAENENNLLEALTKRFKDYGVEFEKGHILNAPLIPSNITPITLPKSS